MTMQNEMTQTVEQATQPIFETTKKSTEAVLSSFERAVSQMAEFGPKLIGAVIVIIIGYVAARLVARFVTTLSDKLGLQRAAERSGLSDSMRHAGVERTIPQI